MSRRLVQLFREEPLTFNPQQSVMIPTARCNCPGLGYGAREYEVITDRGGSLALDGDLRVEAIVHEVGIFSEQLPDLLFVRHAELWYVVRRSNPTQKMIVQIATHWFKPERRTAGIQGLLKTGDLQHRRPGFVSRQVAVAKDDPLQVVSVTTWRSLADVEAFRSDPDRLALHQNLAQNYARPTKQEWFELIDESLY